MIDQEEIHNQCLSENPKERIEALNKLRDNFPSLPDKQQAWKDLIRLTSDQDNSVRGNAAKSLYTTFSHVPDKEKAWKDLHRQLNDEDRNVRMGATIVLISSFSQLPDKQQAWEDLHRRLNDEDRNVRIGAICALRYSFFHISDKEDAWKDLHRLTNDEDSDVRGWTAQILSSAFSQLPDKQQAWKDLHRLTTDENSSVRRSAAQSFGSPFSQLPDKQQAWKDLHGLTTDEDSDVRWEASLALGSAFSYVLDKQQAWNDLHRLTYDDMNVRCGAALAIGSAFSHIPYKEQAFEDLCRLTTDEDWIVQSYANYSLGKVSIFKASQAQSEGDYRKELESAIKFFEKESEKSSSPSLSQFCLPFYRSFHTIIFKQDVKKEVDKYFTEVKDAVRGSKSKELLFEAVENLANALKEIQNLENLDLEAKKGELNFYRQYCDRAVELMIETEETAPFATIAMRKGLPILDRKLKSLIEEIKEKAKTACQEAKGTPAEYAACAVNDFAKKLRIGSPEYLVVQIENLVFLLKSYIPKIEENNLILNRIDKILREEDVVIQYTMLNNLLPQIIDMRVSEKTAPILSEIKCLRVSVDRLIESVDELQNPQEYLDTIQRNLEEIKNEIPEMKGKIDEVLYELYSPLSTDQKLKIAIPIIPALVSYEMETNVPKLVADKIDELKNLVLRVKKSE